MFNNSEFVIGTRELALNCDSETIAPSEAMISSWAVGWVAISPELAMHSPSRLILEDAFHSNRALACSEIKILGAIMIPIL